MQDGDALIRAFVHGAAWFTRNNNVQITDSERQAALDEARSRWDRRTLGVAEPLLTGMGAHIAAATRTALLRLADQPDDSHETIGALAVRLNVPAVWIVAYRVERDRPKMLRVLDPPDHANDPWIEAGWQAGRQAAQEKL